jgi:predicted phosphatase
LDVLDGQIKNFDIENGKKEDLLTLLLALKDQRYETKGEIVSLHKWVLNYEEKIQAILDRKFNLQNLFQKHVVEIKPENLQMNFVNSLTNEVKDLSTEDRNAIADILERTYRRKVE